MYSYGLALPVLVWLALRYIGVGEWSVIEAISVWGYSQFVWIPVAVGITFSCYTQPNVLLSPGSMRHPSPYPQMGPGSSGFRPLWVVSRS